MEMMILHKFLSLQTKLNKNKLPDANRLFSGSLQYTEQRANSPISPTNNKSQQSTKVLSNVQTFTVIYHVKK